MTIDFSGSRWAQLGRCYSQWWAQQLNRPLLSACTLSSLPPVRQQHFADLSHSPLQIARQIVGGLAQKNYLGDAYPFQSMDFSGPGVVAAYLGASISLSSEGRIWFNPMPRQPHIHDLHLRFDPQNPWFCRTVEIIRQVKALSGGNMVLGFPDLGGVMDILSSFFPSQELFFAMADYPDQVLRLIGEIEEAWFDIYHRLFSEFHGFQGYSDWSGLYSDCTCYIHQCDFSYMIGPGDFDRYVLPTLKRAFSRIRHSIYHLDGKGQLRHLDKLLACPQLQAVQWVPGDGGGSYLDYPDLLKKILASGRGTHICGDAAGLLALSPLLGSLQGVYMRCDLRPNDNFESLWASLAL